MNPDQQAQADTPQPKPPAPRLALTDRYLPRVCANPGCPLPPHTTWTVTRSGQRYDRWWRTGETMDLCATHDPDTGQTIRLIRLPDGSQ